MVRHGPDRPRPMISTDASHGEKIPSARRVSGELRGFYSAEAAAETLPLILDRISTIQRSTLKPRFHRRSRREVFRDDFNGGVWRTQRIRAVF